MKLMESPRAVEMPLVKEDQRVTVLLLVDGEVKCHAEFTGRVDRLDESTIEKKIFRYGTHDLFRQLEFWADLVEQGK